MVRHPRAFEWVMCHNRYYTEGGTSSVCSPFFVFHQVFVNLCGYLCLWCHGTSFYLLPRSVTLSQPPPFGAYCTEAHLHRCMFFFVLPCLPVIRTTSFHLIAFFWHLSNSIQIPDHHWPILTNRDESWLKIIRILINTNTPPLMEKSYIVNIFTALVLNSGYTLFALANWPPRFEG